MKLLCFPYAGASGVTFQRWNKYLDGIKIIAIDPPGRGTRIREPLCNTIEKMMVDVKKQVVEKVNYEEEEYAVYGHSMGCLLIYELLHELSEMKFPMPAHVFLSGKNPPNILVDKPISQLVDDEFIKRVVTMGGVSADFFETSGLTNVFLPVLRADLSISELYHYEEKKQRLQVDITFFFASDDGMVDYRYVKQWANYITGVFRMYYFTGGHFFMFGQEQEQRITEIIRETLLDSENNIPY
ncbi:MAG: thioesterase domain-containing protein [Candidatus Azobacteroides sp.]|nr:thioesterase domain-containing protein [Candidatus Azobacteroides sp.]